MEDATDSTPSEGCLPLYDTELDEPGMRDYINTLLLEEMEVMAGEGQDERAYLCRLATLPPSLLSPLLLAEIESVVAAGRGVSGGVGGVGSGSQLAPPPAPPAGAAGAPLDPALWRSLAERAEVSLEHQALLAGNLELASRFAVDTWKAAVSDSQALVARLKGQVQALEGEAEAVNAGRTLAQEGAVKRLGALGKRLREVTEGTQGLAEVVGRGGR